MKKLIGIIALVFATNISQASEDPRPRRVAHGAYFHVIMHASFAPYAYGHRPMGSRAFTQMPYMVAGSSQAVKLNSVNFLEADAEMSEISTIQLSPVSFSVADEEMSVATSVSLMKVIDFSQADADMANHYGFHQ